MKRTVTILLLMVLLLLLSMTSCAQASPQSINDVLEPLRDRYGLPALAAVVISDGKIIAQGAVGVRKFGDKTPVTIDDQFHLGSCGKAMTATIIAVLVEKGELTWTTTMAEIFPEMADEMLPKYQSVTLLHLLSHHAGLPGTGANWPSGTTGVYWWGLTEPITQQRYNFTKAHLCQPPSPLAGDLPEPGTTFLYSNVGFVIAGAVAERVTGDSWEELVAKLLFEPLGITTAGFGAMGTGNHLDQPWQHLSSGGNITPISPSAPYNDNPPVLGPAGRIHMSIKDWAKFVIMHLEGEQGGSKLLKPETFKVLHTPPFGTECGLDWGIQYSVWTEGTVFTHSGSNTANYAQVWMSTEWNFAVLVTTNIGGDGASSASTDAINTLVPMFLPKK